MPLLSASAKRVEQTRSRAPAVIDVGTSMSPNTRWRRERGPHQSGGQEYVHRLGRAAAHEVDQRVDDLRPLHVHLGRAYAIAERNRPDSVPPYRLELAPLDRQVARELRIDAASVLFASRAHRRI